MLNLDLNSDFITEKLGDILPTVRKMKEEFSNPDLSTFICVCIAEFLSLYETERLIQVTKRTNVWFFILFLTRNWQILVLIREISSWIDLCQQWTPTTAKLAKHKPGFLLLLFSPFFTPSFQFTEKVLGSNRRSLLRFSHNKSASLWHRGSRTEPTVRLLWQTGARSRQEKRKLIKRKTIHSHTLLSSLPLTTVQSTFRKLQKKVTN